MFITKPENMIVVTDGCGMADVVDKIFANVSKEGKVTIIIVTVGILAL